MPWYENMPDKRLIFVGTLEIWVIEKPRMKNVNIRVQPDGRVEVSTPRGCPDEIVEDFVRQKYDWILQTQEHYAKSPMGRAATASADEVREWRQLVSAFVPSLIQKWEPVLGVTAGPLVYRKMKTRWGSCQPATGRICINVVLALYPPQCLEYVVVHELVHLRVPGHGPEFYEVMDQVLPDWKRWRDLLRDRT